MKEIMQEFASKTAMQGEKCKIEKSELTWGILALGEYSVFR